MRGFIGTSCAIALLAGGVACQRSDNSRSDAVPTRMSGDSAVIQTTDGAIQLGLVHDTVFMGLTDSVLTMARNDMARDTEETGNRIAATIERFVKNGVKSALQTRMKYPLADIDSAHYSDGSIKFAYRNRREFTFENVKTDKHRALDSFAPEDAQSFVSTVNDAIRKVRGTSR